MKLIGSVWTWFRGLKWWGKVLVGLGLLVILSPVLPKKDEPAKAATAGTTVATVETTAAQEATTEAPPETTTTTTTIPPTTTTVPSTTTTVPSTTTTVPSTTTSTTAAVKRRNVRTFEFQSVQGFDGGQVLTTWATCKRVVSELAKDVYVQPDVTFANARQPDGEVVFFSDWTTLQIASTADVIAGAAREKVSFVCESTRGSGMVRLVELNGNEIG